MDRKGQRGSVTVFLSLTCILFLCLICSTVESARIQGAKAQAANIVGMGNFSVLGEFENALLEDYDVFAVDGSYGSGKFGISKVEERLESFLVRNANPRESLIAGWCFDPWRLELVDSEISKYALLTDEQGEPFYQQVVSYMKTNSAMLAVDALMEYTKDTEKIQKWEEEYERRKEESDSELSGLEEQRKEKQKQLESEAEEGGDVQLPEEKSNPLKEIAKLRKRSILSIVTGDAAVSKKKLSASSLPSKRRLRNGNLKLEREHAGVLANVLFREYLLLHFPNYRTEADGETLKYQVEYILGGKNTDEKNLKYVVNRLLLLREGMNYLYCLENGEMGAEAGGLALTLTGFLGIPALTSATKHALLLAWAYGESLLDVRTLLQGGSVPIFKDASSWTLTLEKLSMLTELLREGKPNQESGMDYEGYLRILLHMGRLSNQKLRALDMIQCNLQKKDGSGKFKAENCVVAIQTETRWNCSPVFLGLPQIVMGVRGGKVTVLQNGSIAY